MDSIQTQTQTPEQKQARYTQNVRTIQTNVDGQLRDLNVGLEKLQQDHPTLMMGDLFMSVHQLDTNFRSLLDLAKEAAAVSEDDVPPPLDLIDHSSSMTKDATSPLGAPNIIAPDETAQPDVNANAGPEPQREENTQGPQKLTI